MNVQIQSIPMKAVRFHEHGEPSVLRYEDAPQPVPGAREVRIRVAGSAFNPVDDGIRGGYLRDAFPVELPHVPGVDVSGTIDGLGDGVTGFAVGDTVVGFLPMAADGSAAEYVIAPAETLAHAPKRLPLADAAAFPSVALTARQAIVDEAGVVAGQRVLVNGAGGAVGSYAVQLAKLAGAYVIATASPRSRAQVEAAGADEVIDHTITDVAVDEPVDVLLNLARIAPEALAALTGFVRDGGVVVNTVPVIQAAGDDARGVRALGLFVRSDAERLATLVDLIDRNDLHIDIAQRRPLPELPAVHAEAAAGTLPGKVVIVVEGE